MERGMLYKLIYISGIADAIMIGNSFIKNQLFNVIQTWTKWYTFVRESYLFLYFYIYVFVFKAMRNLF